MGISRRQQTKGVENLFLIHTRRIYINISQRNTRSQRRRPMVHPHLGTSVHGSPWPGSATMQVDTPAIRWAIGTRFLKHTSSMRIIVYSLPLTGRALCSSSSCGFQGCCEWHNPQASPSLEVPGLLPNGWCHPVPPLAKDALHVLRNAFEYDRGHWNIWSVFHSSSEDTVLLSEHQGVLKGIVLALSLRPDNDVNLKEGI